MPGSPVRVLSRADPPSHTDAAIGGASSATPSRGGPDKPAALFQHAGGSFRRARPSLLAAFKHLEGGGLFASRGPASVATFSSYGSNRALDLGLESARWFARYAGTRSAGAGIANRSSTTTGRCKGRRLSGSGNRLWSCGGTVPSGR